MSPELLMLKDILVCLIADFMEIVHIELPDKWWEVSMAEENRQDLLFEFFDVVDDESEAIGVPANDFLILLILNRNLENL